MRKAMAILSMIFAAVLLVLSLVSFASRSSSAYYIYIEDERYGGDAYTGIQNAAADTARAAAKTAQRVGVLNNTLACVGGGVLLAASFAFFLVSLNFFRPEQKGSVIAERGVTVTQQQTFHTAKLQQAVRTVAPVSEEPAPDAPVPSQKRHTRSEEEDIISKGICPDCGAELQLSDMDDIMTCPDCGRMFG